MEQSAGIGIVVQENSSKAGQEVTQSDQDNKQEINLDNENNQYKGRRPFQKRWNKGGRFQNNYRRNQSFGNQRQKKSKPEKPFLPDHLEQKTAKGFLHEICQKVQQNIDFKVFPEGPPYKCVLEIDIKKVFPSFPHEGIQTFTSLQANKKKAQQVCAMETINYLRDVQLIPPSVAALVNIEKNDQNNLLIQQRLEEFQQEMQLLQEQYQQVVLPQNNHKHLDPNNAETIEYDENGQQIVQNKPDSQIGGQIKVEATDKAVKQETNNNNNPQSQVASKIQLESNSKGQNAENIKTEVINRPAGVSGPQPYEASKYQGSSDNQFQPQVANLPYDAQIYQGSSTLQGQGAQKRPGSKKRKAKKIEDVYFGVNAIMVDCLNDIHPEIASVSEICTITKLGQQKLNQVKHILMNDLKDFVVHYNQDQESTNWKFGINLPEGTVLPQVDYSELKEKLTAQNVAKKPRPNPTPTPAEGLVPQYKKPLPQNIATLENFPYDKNMVKQSIVLVLQNNPERPMGLKQIIDEIGVEQSYKKQIISILNFELRKEISIMKEFQPPRWQLKPHLRPKIHTQFNQLQSALQTQNTGQKAPAIIAQSTPAPSEVQTAYYSPYEYSQFYQNPTTQEEQQQPHVQPQPQPQLQPQSQNLLHISQPLQLLHALQQFEATQEQGPNAVDVHQGGQRKLENSEYAPPRYQPQYQPQYAQPQPQQPTPVYQQYYQQPQPQVHVQQQNQGPYQQQYHQRPGIQVIPRQ